MVASNSSTPWNNPRRVRRVVIWAKNRPTWFGHDALVGVKRDERGVPGRGSSASPFGRRWANRSRHLRAVGRARCRYSARAVLGCPAGCDTMRARVAGGWPGRAWSAAGGRSAG